MNVRAGFVPLRQAQALAALYPVTSAASGRRYLPGTTMVVRRYRKAAPALRLYVVPTGLAWRLVWAESRGAAAAAVASLCSGTIRPRARLARRGDLVHVLEANRAPERLAV